MIVCTQFRALMKYQHRWLESAIDENKWYLSEDAGADVGPEKATDDFCQRHLDRVADQYRREYCTNLCNDRHVCALAPKVHELEGSRQLAERLNPSA
jgi:hypothetical protein